MSDHLPETDQPALTLRYRGVSAVERGEGGAQRVCLFTNEADDATTSQRAQLTVRDPLVLREALRILLTLHQPKGSYLPDDPKIYEAYANWRRSLDPTLTSLELTRSFYQFLGEHDPTAWVGCDPTLSLNAAGLAFETLDPTGRVYAAVHLAPSGYQSEGASLVSAQFDAGEALQSGLSTLHNGAELKLILGAQEDEVSDEHVGALTKTLPTPVSWQRNLTQLLASSTREMREIPLSRMDLYNILQQLRLNADVPKQKKGIRLELIPGKAPALTLEPWNWRLVGTGGVYRGDRAEVMGVWDRRDLMIFDALLPYVEQAQLYAFGEAQPTFWVLHCGDLTFTLATMGFRPSNWSRGVLLDLSLPRFQVNEDMLQQAENLLVQAGELTHSELAKQLDQLQSVQAQEGVTGKDLVRSLLQTGRARPNILKGTLSPRLLFPGLSPDTLRYRDEREAMGQQLAELGRVSTTISELPTGEIEVQGEVTALPADHLPVEARYAPRFQIKEGAGMRKVGCDCAWMKDRERQKQGPCPHVIALWVKYSTDEAARQAELAAHPERVEVATAVYLKRHRGRELNRMIELKKRQLIEHWEDEGENPRHFHRVFSQISAARAAYFKRVAELERHEYMDASQS